MTTLSERLSVLYPPGRAYYDIDRQAPKNIKTKLDLLAISRHARRVGDPLEVKVSNILQFQSGKKIQSITINARAVTDNNNPSGGGNLGPSSLTQNQFIRSKGGGVVYTAITATAN